MSENIQVSSSHHRKVKHKYDKTRLPTPPPDPTTLPTEEDDKDKEQDFLKYLETLQTQHPGLGRSTSIFSPAIAAEDAFDHLERLYKLMDQMLLLKEQNQRLHRRVRDLEHLSNLQKLQKQLVLSTSEGDLGESEKDAAFAETIFENILRDAKYKQNVPGRIRQSILRKQRNRSASLGMDKSSTYDNDRPSSSTTKQTSRRTSAIIQSEESTTKPSKVSKWTKVKAAFKWEKASPTVGDIKMHDSGIGGMLPINYEVARYLRVPSTSEETGVSPADSGAAEISTPGSVSNASSMEDFSRKDFHSSDDEHQYFHHEYIPQSKEEQIYSRLQSNKHHRTPWAKMKDIIHTRGSFKKRHRLSARSDDTRTDEQAYSENEEVFEEETCSRVSLLCPSPTTEPKVKRGQESPNQDSQIPPEIVYRYQQAVADEEMADKTNLGPKGGSKWNRVKKAFLTSSAEVRRRNDTTLIKTETSKKIQDEINRNYKELQMKLSIEFQDKLQEWEKHKSCISSTNTPTASCSYMSEENTDPAFLKKMEEWERKKSTKTIQQKQNLQLQSEENLPPEFRKKLQEWQRIKKGSTKEESTSSKKKLGEWPKWKSVSSHKSDEAHSSSDYPQLSDDFLKKLESWKQIKASGGPFYTEDMDSRKSAKENRTPSPGLTRKNSPAKSNKKGKDQELQWFEKELGKIEKEKQRLERERQKFLEREERLTKLRRSVMGANKKEVLVHTQSGFHRFEGISRKFTQKLYEWEKAQGIAPEASTFALLNSCYPPKISPSTGTKSTPPLVRSKSADSIVTSGLNLNTPLIMSHQPSSLSLNDVEDLEKECLTDSKESCSQYVVHADEDEEEEPEALIVEVEDIIEETAAPLENYLEKQRTPVYQHEGIKSMCAGEACLGPKVRRSESKRAQTNYNFIEDSLSLIKKLIDNENEILEIEQNGSNAQKETEGVAKDITNLNGYYDQQKTTINNLSDKLIGLSEANAKVALNMVKETPESSHVLEVIETIQDLSSEVSQSAEKLITEISLRNGESKNVESSSDILAILVQMNAKILELRRLLSYICAASDTTAPGKKRKSDKKTIKKSTTTTENKPTPPKDELSGKYIKSENPNTSSQGAVKKRIRYRQKSLQSRIPDEESDEEEENTSERTNKHKKLTRTRSITEYSGFSRSLQKEPSNEPEDILVDPDVVQKVVVPTETNIVTISNNQKPPDSPVSVFVKTTRKLFTPIGERGLSTVSKTPPASPKIETVREESKEVPVSHLPPLPASPTPQRKLSKDISPNIRIMLARYNQKISEQEATSVKSGGSSGSNSPVAWRSPIAERRVKAQTERYQQEVKKHSGIRQEVQKSASVGILHPGVKQTTPVNKNLEEAKHLHKGITKSSSAGTITASKQKTEGPKTTASSSSMDVKPKESLKLSIEVSENGNACEQRSPEVRSRQLQKAKEDFLNSGCSSAPVTANSNDDCLKFPARNRLSQISVGSESSCDSSACEGVLIKSASAGMINIDADTYRRIDPEVHREGYVSLPRNCKKPKQGFLDNIASKFRKIKMRRGRDRSLNKMNTVSALCRQSLVVDIHKESSEDVSQENKEENQENSRIHK